MKSLFTLLLLSLASGNSLAQSLDKEPQLVVQDIQCRGNAITACAFIRDRLYLTIGSPVNEEEIGNAKLRLSSLPNFTAVNIYLEKGAEKGRALLIIEVAEADPWTKESVIVTAARASVVYERIAGRISNENLWGTGKVVSLTAGSTLPLSGYSGDAYYSRLQFADPRLFGNSKYFLIGGVFYEKAAIEYPNGSSFKHEYVGADLRVGRRLFDFSYATVEFQYLPTATLNNRIKQSDGTWLTETNPFDDFWLWEFRYGWDTEDDPFFPTRGSRLEAAYAFASKAPVGKFSYGYRQTRKLGNSIWTLNLGDAPGIAYRASLNRSPDIAVAYSRSLAVGGLGEIRRGRWYIEPGGSSVSGHVWEIGIKAGVRLDTKTFGHVDVYVFGSDNFGIGGGK